MTRTAPKAAYRTLGVTPDDDFATIRRAWVRLVKANHPDVVGGDPEEVTRRLTELNDAYDSLCWHNPDKLRIMRERKADERRRKQSEDEARRTGPDRRAGGDRGADVGDRTGTDRRGSDQRRDARPRRDPQSAGTIHAPRETLWSALAAAAVPDRFIAGQMLCTAAPAPRPARTILRA